MIQIEDGGSSTSGIPILQLGIGTVGLELVDLVRSLNSPGGEESRYRYTGVADSSGLIGDPDGLSEDTLEEMVELKKSGEKLADLDRKPLGDLDRIDSILDTLDGGILVDVTGAGGMDDWYRAAFREDWSVVVANKIPLTEMDPDRFNWFRNSGLKYEATVGAGLPVISTLNALLRSGDRVREISAILSGSLSYVLSRLEEGQRLDQAVIEAKEKGFTEPNPVDDLVGKDVHRKALILNRTIGGHLSLEDVEVEPLVDLEDRYFRKEELESRLQDFNEEFDSKLESAREGGRRLRYVARVSKSSASVGLEEVDESSPLARGPGTANVIDIRSRNYEDPSLVIQGPGAGPKVTAGGVFSEIDLVAGSLRR
ncbi:MAG: hypothetical protein ACLFTO_06120 [Candidatus Acetothermia bacterium]